MQPWIVVAVAGVAVALVVNAFNTILRLPERNRRLLELSQRMRKKPDSISEEELAEHLSEMNKLMLYRLAMLLIVFLPIYYALGSRYGPSIETPLGTVNWIIWFIAWEILASMVIGGVKRWLARSSGD